VAEPFGLPAVQEEQQVRQLPPYRVILHNDDVSSFEHVILTILKLTTLNEHEAVQRTLEAHERGQSLLLVTHKERAELYVEQFATFGLTVTYEPGD
jgi:ATP-dependent Clp protease adaptor protein ClpS